MAGLPTFVRNRAKDLMEESVLRCVKSLLHSLSPQNFQEIKDQLVECVGKSRFPIVLQSLVDSIFEMAQAEEVCALLGRLCSELSSELPPAFDEPTGEAVTFRRLLVNKLQTEYESTVSEREDAVMTGDEQRLRPQLLRSVRLLAELFRQRMLTERICHEIIQKLLKPAYPPDMHIEAVCQFCNSIGKLLERSGKSRYIFDAHFDRLKDLARHPQRTQELKVMIHKLIQIRANNWVEATATPSRLSLSYATVGMKSPSDDQEDFENVFEHLEKALTAIKVSQEKARAHRLARMAAELDAGSARYEASTLESKYNEELKRREEKEDALAKEKEELEQMRQELEICKKEQNSLQIKRDNGLRMIEIYKKERDDLQIERDNGLRMIETYKKERDGLQIERDNALKMIETYKKERDGLQVEQDNALKMIETYKKERDGLQVEQDNALKMIEIYEKERDDLQIERDNAFKMVETYQEERVYLQVERDNALKLTEDLLRCKEEETSLQSFIHSEERKTPESFFCPISQDVMTDPHVAADGFTYEAEAIRQWLDSGHDMSPMTNLKLCHLNLIPNHTLRSAIQEWLQQNSDMT